MNAKTDYWRECISISAEECALSLTDAQLACIADGVESGHENYGMAFYSPPTSDRVSNINREWELKYKELQKDFDKYRGNAETAVKQALKQRHDANVSIGEHGEVTLWGGRIERIQ